MSSDPKCNVFSSFPFHLFSKDGKTFSLSGIIHSDRPDLIPLTPKATTHDSFHDPHQDVPPSATEPRPKLQNPHAGRPVTRKPAPVSPWPKPLRLRHQTDDKTTTTAPLPRARTDKSLPPTPPHEPEPDAAQEPPSERIHSTYLLQQMHKNPFPRPRSPKPWDNARKPWEPLPPPPKWKRGLNAVGTWLTPGAREPNTKSQFPPDTGLTSEGDNPPRPKMEVEHQGAKTTATNATGTWLRPRAREPDIKSQFPPYTGPTSKDVNPPPKTWAEHQGAKMAAFKHRCWDEKVDALKGKRDRRKSMKGLKTPSWYHPIERRRDKKEMAVWRAGVKGWEEDEKEGKMYPGT